MLRLVLEFVKGIYGDDCDKAGRCALYHPLGLLAHLDNEKEYCVALLHDVVEDYDVPISMIYSLYGAEIAEAVNAISRRADEKYFDYIRRCVLNPIAAKVKRADLLYNINRSPELPDNDSLAKRYRKAMVIVEEAIKEHNNAGNKDNATG